MSGTGKSAVLLAGGKGTRLRPYTTSLPKPLMPVGERPILEIIVRQLRRGGFTRLTFAVGHLAALIEAYFGDGSRFGVTIDYSLEDTPLGTAGPLSRIAPPGDDFLVMNGDVLTDLDYAAFLEEHEASGAMATVAVFPRVVDISLGVLDLDAQGQVVKYTEKPRLEYLASTGIYCFRPEVLSHIPQDTRFDLPDLVTKLLAAGEVVRGHRYDGYWLDIGRPEDYERAVEAVESGEVDA